MTDVEVARSQRTMGIEARCPNGHQVRVKDRFAGKKAYCPECGATFRVPMADAVSTPPTAVIVSLDATYAATLPRATAVVDHRHDMPRRDADERRRRRRGDPRDRAASPTAAAPRRLHAVIAEAVDLTWNVALPGGDPSEPLSAETLQEWLDAGGVTGDELVWRSDWPDWVPIRLVFPEHVPKATG